MVKAEKSVERIVKSKGSGIDPGTLAAGVPAVVEGVGRSAPELYLNRELTWLEFNWRVFHEAKEERTPLLERVKFAAIAGSNLDEFFMKRIGGLKQQVGAGVHDRTIDGRTPREQIDECYAIIREFQGQKQLLLTELWKLLGKNGIDVLVYGELSDKQKKLVREDYLANIYPLITPQSIDPAHPFPSSRTCR